MTDLDYGTFDRAFRRVVGTFRLKLKGEAVDELARTYFKVLEAAPLDEVLLAAKTCLATCTHFPRPVEWLNALPTPVVAIAGGGDLRVMTTPERVEYWRAVDLRYVDEPCGCLLCQAANTVRPLRFVPDEDDEGRVERAVDPIRNREVVTGHWAHGAELVQWYAARDAFFASVPRRSPLARALLALVPREPGEEG